MEIYYTIHILVFLSCIFELSSVKTKKCVMLVWMLFFTLFGGLRWEIGGDWDQYLHHFQNSEFSNIFSYDRYGNSREKLEPGFVFMNALIRNLFGEFYIYNLLLVAFIQITYYKFCLYFSPRHPLLMYAFLMLMVPNYFPVRAAFAISIGMWSYKHIKEHNLKSFLILVFLATLIHYQCIVLLPLYWIGKVHLGFIPLTMIYVSFALLGMLFQQYFALFAMLIGGEIGNKALGYTENETVGAQGASYIGWALNYFFLCVYVFLRKKMQLRNDRWFNALINITIAYNAFFMVFSEGMGDLVRVASNFFHAQAILFILSITYFAGSPKPLQRIGGVSFFIAYYIYRLLQIGSGYYFEDTCIPYKTIFDYGV